MKSNVDQSRSPGFWRLSFLLPIVLVMLPACQNAAENNPHSEEAGGPYLEEAANPHLEEVMDGQEAFENYCAACHGLDARGNGPVASVLNIPPPDLTQLQNKFDGVYPSEYVLRTVDGRHQFLAHGTRQMPIWGNIWREDSTAGSEIKVQRRLNTLLHYLETIQE